jgi:hypothetical protein
MGTIHAWINALMSLVPTYLFFISNQANAAYIDEQLDPTNQAVATCMHVNNIKDQS